GNFTVSAGDVISFHVDSPDIPTNLTLTPFIGVVNSLEIVPVPEPGTACLALAGSALLWRGRQRTA
ncbi:MAG: PEP-CTERM sorting domain-containing protein, partial [Planctomycetota bacterium]